MKILGIDPGTATTGWGVIEIIDGETILIASGLVETDKKQEHGKRLNLIYEGIFEIIKKYQPSEVAIERLFFATNALTAIAVGQAIGVIKLAINHSNLDVYDYAPMQVKLVLTGSGKSDKKAVKTTIKKMFKIREKKGMKTHFDNTADALAIAVCHYRKKIK